MTRYGYACMNTTLREADDVRTNKGMQQKTFEERGLQYAGELAERNVRGLLRVLAWNRDHDIRFYRITSDLVPWYSQFELEELPNSETVLDLLAEVGEVADRDGVRLTFHPSYFVKLASEDPDVIDNAVTDLENHGALMDAMGLARSPFNAINVHIGAHYGDKAATAERFCRTVEERLSPAVRSRLTVENDDKESLWSVPELVESVYEEVGVPVTYDELHHQFSDRGLSRAEAARAAADTWGDVRPVFHYSESRALVDPDASVRNHTELVTGPIRTYGVDADVMIEAKGKERALLNYREAERAAAGDRRPAATAGDD